MRHIPFLSIAGRTGVSLRVLRQFGSLLLPLPAVVLTALHLHAQVPTAYTPKELLATDPRVFTDWLETHRPRSVSRAKRLAFWRSYRRKARSPTWTTQVGKSWRR